MNRMRILLMPYLIIMFFFFFIPFYRPFICVWAIVCVVNSRRCRVRSPSNGRRRMQINNRNCIKQKNKKIKNTYLIMSRNCTKLKTFFSPHFFSNFIEVVCQETFYIFYKDDALCLLSVFYVVHTPTNYAVTGT